jgi:mono/diheme cytochrome c family protein
VACGSFAETTEGRPEPPPLAEAPEKIVPGLTLTFESAAPGASDARDARLVALYVPEGTAPTPFLPPGSFHATWEGFLYVDLATDCTFSAEGRGKLTVMINDKAALEIPGDDLSEVRGPLLRLKKGRNRLTVRYESPSHGDASIRLFWASDEFGREPVPPTVFSHDGNVRPLRQARRLREGRELLATRRCLRCHAHEVPKEFPELEMDAPALTGIGARLNVEWIAHWLKDPRSLRPDAVMPNVLHGSAQDAADIAAYLSTSGKPTEEPVPAPEVAASGGRLFAQMRCGGCHTLPDRDPAPERVPLRHVRAKWKPAALRGFLLQPEKHYAWIRMPNFKLSEGEADKLAAFLLERSSQELSTAGWPSGNAERGRGLLEAVGCLNCHALAPLAGALKAPALKDIPAQGWTRGCMAESPDQAPDHGLSPEERRALLAFAASDLSSLSRESPPEFAERQIQGLRCLACHKCDDRPDFWSEVASEAKHLVSNEDDELLSKEIEKIVPPLTWAGEKLKTEWMASFLAGDLRYGPRPWLDPVRMPRFRTRAALLARGLAFLHGCPPTAPPDPWPDEKLAQIGRRLAGNQGGLACVSCHDVGPTRAGAVFEAPGPNFKHARERLRKDYYHRWMLLPARVEPGTKMPQFAQGKRSQLTEILEGDAVRQFEALWQYLLEGEKIKPPEH